MASFNRFDRYSSNLKNALVSLSQKTSVPLNDMLPLALKLLFVRGLTLKNLYTFDDNAWCADWPVNEKVLREAIDSYQKMKDERLNDGALLRLFNTFNQQLTALFNKDDKDEFTYPKISATLIRELIWHTSFAGERLRDTEEDYQRARAAYDYLFYILLPLPSRPLEQFYSRLLNGLHGNDHAVCFEAPLLTGEIAVDAGDRQLLLDGAQPSSLFVLMRLFFHQVVLSRRREAQLYLYRASTSPLFNFSAIAPLLQTSQALPFIALIEVNRQPNKAEFNRLKDSERLLAVIEFTNRPAKSLRRVFLLAERPTTDDVLFINTSLIGVALELNKTEEAELVGATLTACFELPWKKLRTRNEMSYQTQDMLARLSNYKDLPGYCQRVPRHKIDKPAHLRTASWIPAPTEKDTFEGLSVRKIYAALTGNGQKCHYIIGNNGVGKSFLLRDIAQKIEHEKPQIPVLMLAFGLSDRFQSIKKAAESNLIYLGDKQTARGITLEKRERELAEGIITIFRSERRKESFEKMLSAIDFTPEVYLLPYGYSIINNELYSDAEIYNISILEPDNIASIKKPSNFTLAFEKKRNRNPLLFHSLSSGEQHILLLFIRILSNIQPDCYILIDEPELSLHVKWQQLLPQLFTQLSEDFGAKIVVATHSPVLLASVKHSNSVCYQASPGRLTLISQYDLRNMEAALVDAFDLVTSNNRSIYEHCATAVANFMEKVNQVDVKGMTMEKTKALKTLEGLRAKLNNNLVKVDSLASDLKLIDRAGIAIKEMYAACLSEATDE